MEQVLERMERKLENIGTEQVRMREDIARIKGKLEGRIDTRTTIIAWAGVVFGIAALLLKLFRTDAIRWYVRGFAGAFLLETAPTP